MAKQKSKPRRPVRETVQPAEPKPNFANPPQASTRLLSISSVLLATWLIYLLVVAIWGT